MPQLQDDTVPFTVLVHELQSALPTLCRWNEKGVRVRVQDEGEENRIHTLHVSLALSLALLQMVSHPVKSCCDSMIMLPC